MSISYESRPAWREQWLPLTLGILLLPVFGLGLIFILWVVVGRYASHYKIENGRIQVRNGIVSKDERSIRIKDLRDVALKQSVVERLLRIGTLEFSSSGSHGAEVVFAGILKPKILKSQIESERDS